MIVKDNDKETVQFYFALSVAMPDGAQLCWLKRS